MFDFGRYAGRPLCECTVPDEPPAPDRLCVGEGRAGILLV